MAKSNPLIGKTIRAIHLAQDRQAIRFDVEEGKPIVVRADGDCCSHTWIEALDTPGLLIGGVVATAEDIDMPAGAKSDTDNEDDVVQYYGCKITTNKGQCVIDYRNSSNGYYGGNLAWPGEYFYGGVHGQNESKLDWQQVAP